MQFKNIISYLRVSKFNNPPSGINACGGGGVYTSKQSYRMTSIDFLKSAPDWWETFFQAYLFYKRQ